MTADARVEAVVEAIARFVRLRCPDAPGADLLCRAMSTMTPASRPRSPAPPIHDRDLASVLTQLGAAEDDALVTVGRSIHEAAGALSWAVDDGQYYRAGAEVGDGYRFGNMHTVLAESSDAAVGLFLLKPQVDYLDHRHRAPEFYLNLTGPTLWRFEFGPWEEMPAGSSLWNEPERIHATRTGDAPWLSFWAWLGDIDAPCEVVAETLA